MGDCLLPRAAAAQFESDFGTFGDVEVEHWAFLTVETLVRKYKVMAGFPDGTFGGDRRVSRYELAAALTKVMEQMRLPVAPPPPKVEVEAIKAVSDNLELAKVKPQVQQLLDEISKINTTGPAAVRMSGSISTLWIDNTQDDQAPFSRANLNLNVASSTDGFDVSAAMFGAVPATITGNMPGTVGGGKPPETNWRFGGANVSTNVADTRVVVGQFSPAMVFYPASTIPARWWGVLGTGFIKPDVNTVRWGARAAAVAANRQLGPVTLAAAVTPTVVLAGLSAEITKWLSFKAAADVDQPDWWGITPNRTTASNYTVVMDANAGDLAVSLEGNMARNLMRGSLQFSWAFWKNMRLNAGAVYSESEKAITELTPGISLFVPAQGPGWIPSVIVGVKEPQILSASDPKVNPGPGSLLGEQAGLSVDLNWDLGAQGWPNIAFEYNLQQPVLFYSIYDATFALSITRGF